MLEEFPCEAIISEIPVHGTIHTAWPDHTLRSILAFSLSISTLFGLAQYASGKKKSIRVAKYILLDSWKIYCAPYGVLFCLISSLRVNAYQKDKGRKKDIAPTLYEFAYGEKDYIPVEACLHICLLHEPFSGI